MYGPNVGLEIGRRALMAQQLALNLTGHNIANVNTPGFSRQQAVMSSNLPLAMPFGVVGTGVDVTEIRRLRSVFLDQQFRNESQKLGQWDKLDETWKQVEAVYSEPEDTGLSAMLDQFWNSWQALSNNPESQAARVSVREQASLLSNSFKHLSGQLNDLRNSLDSDISKMVEQINSVATQIADLNHLISVAELSGGKANDLRDQRDYLVDTLSQWVKAGVVEQRDGSYTVFIGSMALVDGTNSLTLGTEVQSNGATTTHRVFFEGTGVDISNPGGQFQGLIESRDTVLVKRMNDLDQLASELARSVNDVHRTGFGADGSTNMNFFKPDITGAADFEIDPLIEDNVNLIAASSNGEIGDNSNALNIAALRNELKFQGGRSTFNGFYDAMVGEIGIGSSESNNMKANQQAMVSQISNSRQSLSGVSLDEEMANMLQYQHSYEAAARVITAMDSALDTVINGMGLVGR